MASKRLTRSGAAAIALVAIAGAALVFVAGDLLRPPRYAVYRNAAAAWAAEYPAAWHVHAWINPSSAAFLSYDAGTAEFQRGIPFMAGAAPVPRTELRIEVEVHDNPDRVDAETWSDRQLASPPYFAGGVSDRGVRTIAGQTGSIYTETASMAHRVSVVQKRVFVSSPDRHRMYDLKAYPADSLRIAEFEHLLSTFTLR